MCGAATRAGAIKADSMAISGGNVTIKESTAKLNGGGGGGGGRSLLVLKHGVCGQQFCDATTRAGALSADSIAISGGNVTIKESMAKLNGGMGGGSLVWS